MKLDDALKGLWCGRVNYFCVVFFICKHFSKIKCPILELYKVINLFLGKKILSYFGTKENNDQECSSKSVLKFSYIYRYTWNLLC